MQIYLGAKTNKKALQNLLQKLGDTPLKFIGTKKSFISYFAMQNIPYILDSRQATLLHSDFVFLPNQQEKILCKKHKILFYDPPSQSLIKFLMKSLRFISLEFLDRLLILFCRKTPTRPQGILVIRTDAIGDYVLFRNFLKPLYEHYGKITLVANIANKEFVESFDMPYIDTFIPLQRKAFLNNPFYHFTFLKKIRQKSYALLINPLFSRDLVSEQIARFAIATQKITCEGDVSNLSSRLESYFNSYYTKILPSNPKILFEFFRNLEFFENLLEKKLDTMLEMHLKNPQDVLEKFNIQTPYAVLFIGASTTYRKWSKESFLEIAEFLSKQGFNIVVCGGMEDKANADFITHNLQHSKAYNLCGATSLCEVAKIVYNGNHLLSNETSCVHIAKAIVHDKIFVVYNGNHFHRFTPYPKGLGGEYYGIYHPIIRKNPNAYAIFSNFLQQSTLNIHEITPKDVKEVILENL